MSSKFLLLFLGTFLLVQSSLGKALPLSKESTEETDATTLQPEIDDEPETPSNELLYYVVNQITKVSESGLEPGKKLLQDVIADISALDEENEEITAKLEEYSNLVAEIEKLLTEGGESDVYSDKIDAMVALGDLLDKSNVTLIEEPTRVDKLFEESLQRNGLSDLDQHIEEKFEEEFSKDFYENVEEILNSATIEEWPEKTDIQDWLKRFKAENDLENKSKLLEEFFKFYE